MTPRERTLKTLLFEQPDLVPLEPGHGRKSTRENWYQQGLPRKVKNINECAYRLAGGTLPWPRNGKTFPVNERMVPQFEEKVLEKKENSQIVQDWKGNICEISNDYTVAYLRNAIDFVTRRWIKCPVETRTDWKNMKKRYDPDDPHRLPANPRELGKDLVDRDWFLEIQLPGPFWQLREWLGFENLCVLFYDDPDWTREMINFWGEYIIALLQQVFKYFIPDSVHISEDMAYKSFSMISPDMCREFLLPVWKKWGDLVRAAGIPIYAVDSDGYIGELIPLWIQAGINVCDPIEVAAGNDINQYRQTFGRQMAFRGGVDKRAMAKGGTVIENEMELLEMVIKDGGYIPSCDHGVPPDVSWPDYLHYVKILAQSTGWL